ncbi:MAG: energy transducer TonB [Vicinamibacterales bacterium]
MTLSGIRIAGVVLVGVGVVGLAGRALAAQTAPKVAVQIVPPDQEDEFVKGAVSAKAPGVVPPKVLNQTDPKYTVNAMRARIEGSVKIQAIVGLKGRIEKSRVKEPLHPDLDAEALRTLDSWEFEPGRVNGQPARVLIEVDMMFRIHR